MRGSTVLDLDGFGLWSKLDRQVVALVSRVLCVVS